MANTLTQLYRQYLAETGQRDERDDRFITAELGQWAQQSRPGLFSAFPDFGQEWKTIREANAPSLGQEVVRGIKRGGLGLGATAAGAIGLFTDSDYFKQKARELEESAASPDLAPTIPAMEDIEPGRDGISQVLSRDTARYAASKFGEAAPSIAESVGTAAIGAVAGSATAPGPGTIAGGAAGFLGKSAIKAGIREMLRRSAREGAESLAEGLVRKGVLREASEEAIEQAVKAGERTVLNAVTSNARRISALRGGQAANLANAYGLSAGEIYNETDDRSLALGLGAVAAIPDTILPAYVLRRMFPGVQLPEARQLGKNYVARLAREGLTTSGIEAGTEAFQESVNIVARNLSEGRDPLSFDDADWVRVREAAVTGAAGGALVAPATAVQSQGPEISVQKPTTVAPPAAPAVILPPATLATPAAPSKSTIGRLNRMSDSEKLARIAELEAKEARTAPEERELTALRALAPRAQAPAAPVLPELEPTDVPPAELEAMGAAVSPPAPIAPVVASEPAPTPEQQAEFERATRAGDEYVLGRGMVGAPVLPELEAVNVAINPLLAAAKQVAAFTPQEFREWAGRQEGGFTTTALEIGAAARNAPAILAELQAGKAAAEAEFGAAMAAARALPREAQLAALNEVSPLSSKVQFFNEALQAASEPQTGGTQDAIQERSPTPVFSGQPQETQEAGGGRGGVDGIFQGPETPQAPAPLAVEGQPAPPQGSGQDAGGGVVAEQLPEGGPFAGSRLTKARQAGSIIYLSFDLTAKPPTTAALKSAVQALGYDSSVVEFEPNLISTANGEQKFRIDIYSPTGGASSAAAADVLSKLTGGNLSVPSETQRNVPMDERVARTVKAYRNREAGGIPGESSEQRPLPPEIAFRTSGEATDNAPIVIGRVMDDGEVQSSSGFGSGVQHGGRGLGFNGYTEHGWRFRPDLQTLYWWAPPAEVLRESVKAHLEKRGHTISREITIPNPSRADNPDAEEAATRVYQEAHGLKFRSTSPLPAVQATRTREFQAVMSRIIANGGDVRLLTEELFAQSVAETIQQQIADLQSRLPQATPAQRADFTRAIAIREQRIAELAEARGVTYDPWHAAIAMQDVANASLDNLVTLLHEAAESLTMRMTPAMKGRVFAAVEAARAEMVAKMQAAARNTGATVANVPDPGELLAESLAQRLAAEGIQDAPSLAQSIVRFIKDLYYRVSMAMQRAFGLEPNPELALRWYENQLRREVGGDFDYRFAHLLDRFLPQSNIDRLAQQSPAGGTPGNIGDFLDPVTLTQRQPWVEPLDDSALQWNAQFRTIDPNPGEGDGIPSDEANARLTAAGLNEVVAWMQEQHRQLAPDTEFDSFVRAFGRGTETPMQTLARIAEQSPGAETATIGGERMTDPMNKWGAHGALVYLTNLRTKHLDKIAKLQNSVKEAEDAFTAAATEVNEMEANVRDAQMHEAQLKAKVRAMMKDTLRLFREGLGTSNRLGELILTEEGLLAKDPLPEFYDQVFNALANGQVPLFEYIEAIALLDLPLAKMQPNEVWKAIRENRDASPALKALSNNKPLALTLSVLSQENARQLDQIQLRRADAVTYRDIKQELDNIRNATEAQLREMMAAQDDRQEAKGLRQRLRAAYMKERRNLRRQSERIAAAEDRIDLLTRAQPALNAKIGEMEQATGGIFSDWQPVGGAEYTAMRLDGGEWRSAKRRLEFRNDGAAVNAEQIQSDLAMNLQWLRENQQLKGQRTYNEVLQQTMSLGLLDVNRAYSAANYNYVLGKVDAFVRPIQAIARAAGHSAGNRIVQQLNQYGTIIRFSDQFKVLGNQWANSLIELQKSTGIKDHGRFLKDIYNPVMYFLGVNPGLDEAQAIRAATKEARRRLPTQPGPEFEERFARFLRSTKEANDSLLKIAEQYNVFVTDPKLGNAQRRALDRGWLTGMRAMNASVVNTLLRDMANAGWTVGNDSTPSTFAALDPDSANPEDRAAYFEQLENADLLRQVLAPFFNPRVLNDWLVPFINKPGEPVFRYGGRPISQLSVQQAWESANGDVLTWIDNLGQLVGAEPSSDESSAAAEFRLSMLKQLDGLYGYESKLAAEANVAPDVFGQSGPKPHMLMDARMSDFLPPEHVKFVAYEPESIKQTLGAIAFHGAFGRDGAALEANIKELQGVVTAKKEAFDSLRGTTQAERRAEAAERGWDYDDLKASVKRYNDVMELVEKARAAFGTKNIHGPLHDAKAGLEVLGFLVGQAVDRPTTALLNLLSLGQRPFGQRSLGPLALRGTATAYADFLKQGFGGFLRAFGIDIVKLGEWEAELGAVEGRAFKNVPWSVLMSDIGRDGNFQEDSLMKYLVRPLRTLRAIQKKGVGAGPIGLPGLGSMSRLQAQAAISNARGTIGQVETLLARAIRYFSTHPEDLANPAFRFDPKDLSNWSWDRSAIETLRTQLTEYGLGTLENMAREAIPRQEAGDRMLTKEQVQKLAILTSQELDGASSVNATPAGLYTNPALSMAIPLLRWPLWMMNMAHRALAEPNGQMTYKSMLKGMGVLAAWNLPLGLAFTFMLDEYDEKLLGRKNANPPAERIGAIPFVGPALALATTDRPIPQEALAMGLRLTRSGSAYGLGADLIAQAIAPFDPASGQRVFSLDQRVLVMSQLLNFYQATRNLVAQGGDTTWGSVWRPMVTSIGGNGVLHSLDLVNSTLNLDNAEARNMRRLNAQRWVNAAAREIGLEVKGVGSFSTPTPLSLWTREMFTASMANDRMGFMEAYNRALDAARERVAEDPDVAPGDREKEAAERVLRSWRSRNPFSWLPSRPTEPQWRQMLEIMSEQGRGDVEDAVRRFDQFTTFIAPSPMERYIARRMRPASMPTPESLRRRMASGMMLVP